MRRSGFMCGLVVLAWMNWAVLGANGQGLSEPSLVISNNTYLVDLPTVLRLAGARNLDVKIARERLHEAEANRSSALEQFFPWVSPTATFGRHDGNIQAVDGTIMDVHKQAYAVGGSLTAEITPGDAIYNSLATRQLAKAADSALEAQLQDTTSIAAQAYFDLIKAKAIAGVLREAVNISEDYQKQLHEAVSAGIAFKGDELRVQTQTERYQVSLRQGIEQKRLASAALSVVLRLDSRLELIPPDAELVPLLLVETNAALDSLVNQALRFRPELKQSQALIAATSSAQNGAKFGPLVPNLSAQVFVGGLGGGKNDSTGNFSDAQDYQVGLGWRIGPGGLFDFGRMNATKARFETVRLTGEKLLSEITRQVVEALTQVQSLADQMDLAQKNLATASEALRLSRERKEFGVGVVLEDIQAQQELTRARSDYVAAIADFNKAQYRLAKAVGTVSGISRPAAR